MSEYIDTTATQAVSMTATWAAATPAVATVDTLLVTPRLIGNARQRRKQRRAAENAFAEWAEGRATMWDGPGEGP